MAEIYFPDGSKLSDIPRGILTSPSRSLDTIYQNTTGRPIFVVVSVYFNLGTGASTGHAQAVVGTTSPPTTTVGWVGTNPSNANAATFNFPLVFIVPNNYYYKIETFVQNASRLLDVWVEY